MIYRGMSEMLNLRGKKKGMGLSHNRYITSLPCIFLAVAMQVLVPYFVNNFPFETF